MQSAAAGSSGETTPPESFARHPIGPPRPYAMQGSFPSSFVSGPQESGSTRRVEQSRVIRADASTLQAFEDLAARATGRVFSEGEADEVLRTISARIGEGPVFDTVHVSDRIPLMPLLTLAGLLLLTSTLRWRNA